MWWYGRTYSCIYVLPTRRRRNQAMKNQLDRSSVIIKIIYSAKCQIQENHTLPSRRSQCSLNMGVSPGNELLVIKNCSTWVKMKMLITVCQALVVVESRCSCLNFLQVCTNYLACHLVLLLDWLQQQCHLPGNYYWCLWFCALSLKETTQLVQVRHLNHKYTHVSCQINIFTDVFSCPQCTSSSESEWYSFQLADNCY